MENNQIFVTHYPSQHRAIIHGSYNATFYNLNNLENIGAISDRSPDSILSNFSSSLLLDKFLKECLNGKLCQVDEISVDYRLRGRYELFSKLEKLRRNNDNKKCPKLKNIALIGIASIFGAPAPHGRSLSTIIINNKKTDFLERTALAIRELDYVAQSQQIEIDALNYWLVNYAEAFDPQSQFNLTTQVAMAYASHA